MDLTAARATPGVAKVVEVSGGFADVAHNKWSAFEGASAIDATWAPAVYPSEQEAHWHALEATIATGKPDAVWRKDGCLPKGLAQEAHPVEYRAPYVVHQLLEPLNATILVHDAGAELWTATQVPRFVQAAVARVTGHSPE